MTVICQYLFDTDVPFSKIAQISLCIIILKVFKQYDLQPSPSPAKGSPVSVPRVKMMPDSPGKEAQCSGKD